MATSGELIRIVSEVLVLKRSHVTSCFRALQADAVVSKGGRGRSASHVSVMDTARLIICMMATDSLLEAVPVTQLMMSLKATRQNGVDELAFNLDYVVGALLRDVTEPWRAGPFGQIADPNVRLEISPSKLEARILSDTQSMLFTHSPSGPLTDNVEHQKIQARLIDQTSIVGMVTLRSIEARHIEGVAVGVLQHLAVGPQG